MRLIFRLLAAAILVTIIGANAFVQSEHSPAQAASSNFGLIFTAGSSASISNTLSKLGITWWYDFGDNGAKPAGFNKVLLVRTSADNETCSADTPPPAARLLPITTLQSMAAANPGAYWIIGNEPNVPGQDDVGPWCYVPIYNYYATNIKAIDPSARLVAPNVLNWQTTCICPGGFESGLSWVETFLSKYQDIYHASPPVDVWGIHTYLIAWPPADQFGQPPPQENLPMVQWQFATAELAAFRAFLNATPGQSGKPIWITEFGVIWGYDGIQSAADGTCANGTGCVAPLGQYRQDLITQYLQGYVGWLNANSQSLNIQKWFLFTAFGPPEVYSSAYAGISAMDGPGATANLSTSGQMYRDLAGGNPTPTPSSGGGGGGGDGGASTPTATRTPTTALTPTPTATPAPPDTTTGSVGSLGGELNVRGGSSADGGVSVIFPQSALDQGTDFEVVVVNEQPASVNQPSGATLLNKTIEVTPRTLTTLRGTVGIRINLTATELGGRALSDIRGGVITGATVEPRPTRIVDETQSIIWIDVDHFSRFTLFAVTNPGPELVGPANEVVLPNLGTILTWTNPLGTTQYQIQVIPFNNDGPGIDLIRNVESSFALQAPNLGGGDPNYVMLPGMHYVWRIRTTTSGNPPSQLTENDWSAWSLRSFMTPTKLSSTISLASPQVGNSVNTRTPALVWANADNEVFYYEVQVSKDPEYGANAFLYWELRHGGVTNPPNSYTIPSQFPLEQQTTYYWRVRPRIQGDGAPVSWSSSNSFSVAP